MSKVLEFKEKKENISLPELKETIRTEDVSSYSKVLPVEHFQVFDMVLEAIDKNNITPKLNPIMIQGGSYAKIIKRVEEQYGLKALEAHWLQRVYGEICFDTDNNDLNNLLRIEYSEKGITISFGQIVLVCSNGMTAFEGDILTTYGKNKTSYDQIKEVVNAWMVNLGDKNKQYNELISSMKNHGIDEYNNSESIPAEIINIIGKLETKAVTSAYIDSQQQSPFTITQVSSFTKNIIERLNEEEKIDTVWDLYNIGTSIQKAEMMEMNNVSRSNLAFTKFITNEYTL